MVIDVRADKYRLNENDNLKNIFNEKIVKYYLASIQERINDYLELLDISDEKKIENEGKKK